MAITSKKPDLSKLMPELFIEQDGKKMMKFDEIRVGPHTIAFCWKGKEVVWMVRPPQLPTEELCINGFAGLMEYKLL
jgi:hypothetical protein